MYNSILRLLIPEKLMDYWRTMILFIDFDADFGLRIELIGGLINEFLVH